MNDLDSARQLVRQVILAQSNLFIKELLLSKDIRGGVAKSDFQDQLDSALRDGTITYEELKNWVDETEGWGDEHVYLYRVATSVDRLVSDDKYAADRVKKAGFDAMWGADTSLEFPAQRTLTSIHQGDNELTFVWHQGTQFEKRAPEKDFQRVEDDGEEYLYKAWRIASQRDVTRIVIRPKLAAVFLPSRSEPKTHADERVALMKEIKRIVDMFDWPLYSMGEAIKILDKKAMDAPAEPETPRARNTKLTAKGGGWVEFASETDVSYSAVEPLREVRLAVSPEKFRGAGGEFRFALTPNGHNGSSNGNGSKAKARMIRVQLYGDYDRLRMWVRLKRDEMWKIIDAIPKRSVH